MSSDVGCRYQAICASSTGCKGPFLLPACAFGAGWIPVLFVSGSVTRPACPGLRRGGCGKTIKIKPRDDFEGCFFIPRSRQTGSEAAFAGCHVGPRQHPAAVRSRRAGASAAPQKGRRVCPVCVSVKVENIP